MEKNKLFMWSVVNQEFMNRLHLSFMRKGWVRVRVLRVRVQVRVRVREVRVRVQVRVPKIWTRVQGRTRVLQHWMGVAGWRGGTTNLCPRRQKPSRRHCFYTKNQNISICIGCWDARFFRWPRDHFLSLNLILKCSSAQELLSCKIPF